MHYQLKIHEMDDGYVDPEGFDRHMSTARKRAIQVAAEYGVPVVIERVTDGPLKGREGFERGRSVSQVKAVLVINPDGSASPPTGAKAGGTVESCTASPDGPPCFCDNCRAARKAQR